MAAPLYELGQPVVVVGSRDYLFWRGNVEQVTRTFSQESGGEHLYEVRLRGGTRQFWESQLATEDAVKPRSGAEARLWRMREHGVRSGRLAAPEPETPEQRLVRRSQEAAELDQGAARREVSRAAVRGKLAEARCARCYHPIGAHPTGRCGEPECQCANFETYRTRNRNFYMLLAVLTPIGSVLYGVFTKDDLGGWIFAGVVMGAWFVFLATRGGAGAQPQGSGTDRDF